MANDTIVDIYCHIMPEKFSEEMSRIAPRLGNIAARLRGVKKLFDLDERFREMDQFGITAKSSPCRTRPSRTSRPATLASRWRGSAMMRWLSCVRVIPNAFRRSWPRCR